MYWAKQALTIQIRTPNRPDLEYTLDDLGLGNYDLHRYDAAKNYFSSALRLCDHRTSHYPDLISHLAHVYRDQGRCAEAMKLELRALQIRKQREPGSINLSASFNNLGMTEKRLHHPAAALVWYRLSYSLRKRLEPLSSNFGDTCEQAAELLIQIGRPREALPFAIEGSNMRRRMYDWPTLDTATKEGFEELMLYMRALVPAYVLTGRPDKALETVEWYRGRLFEQSLSFRRYAGQHFNALEKQRRSISLQIGSLYQQLDHESDTRRQELLVNDVQNLRSHERRLQSEEFESTSGNHPLGIADTLLSAKQIRATLAPKVLLLEYALCGERCWVFAVTRSGVKAVALPAGEQAIDRLVSQYSVSITGGYPSAKLAEELYNVLVKPVGGEVRKCSRLIISAQGSLSYLPFTSLIAKSNPFPVYLGQVRPIQEAISASSLLALRQHHAAPRLRTLDRVIIGDPIFGQPGDSRGESLRSSSQLAKLDRMLPSLRRIAAFPRSVLLTQSQATIGKVMKFAPQAKIVHLATHGKSISFDPLGSWLAFTPESADDGFLRADDILSDLRLNADLVVLCGCETASGAATLGEGINGLTRCTLAAGASSVVSSLWNADLDATNLLMEAFYIELNRGNSLSVALQHAQTITRRRFPNPYYWAGFILTGLDSYQSKGL